MTIEPRTKLGRADFLSGTAWILAIMSVVVGFVGVAHNNPWLPFAMTVTDAGGMIIYAAFMHYFARTGGEFRA